MFYLFQHDGYGLYLKELQTDHRHMLIFSLQLQHSKTAQYKFVSQKVHHILKIRHHIQRK
jgi:hypothetical protein